VRLKSGKHVTAWAAEGDLDADAIRSNTFEMEWPPRSGRMQAFPEVDRAGWFGLEAAREKLNPAQAELVDRLQALLAG
jgi:predicted NUDIX family NTP pyrophosphohydrolase